MTVVVVCLAFIHGNDRCNVLLVCRFVADGNVAVAGTVIQPDRCPGQLIVVVAGLVEAAVIALGQHLAVLALFVRIDCHLIKILCALETLFRILRLGILEVQVADCQCSRSACTHIRCAGIGLLGLCLRLIGFLVKLGLGSTDFGARGKDILPRAEVCRSCKIKQMLALQIRAEPVVVVNVALADLIDIGEQLAVLVVVERFQIEIAEGVQDILHMLCVSGLFVRLTEFVVAPAECRCGIGAGQTELDMVARVVHTALTVETAVAVGIQLVAVLLNPSIRQIDALEISTVLLQRDVLILHVAVAAPLQDTGALAALVGIVEGQRILHTLCKIDLDIVVGKAVRIRKSLILVLHRAGIFTRGCTCLNGIHTRHRQGKRDAEQRFQPMFLSQRNHPPLFRLYTTINKITRIFFTDAGAALHRPPIQTFRFPAVLRSDYRFIAQQFLYFFPLPHGQGSFGPTFFLETAC